MSRRDFITVLGGVVGLPLTARAQQPMPAIGYLGSGSGSLGTSDVFGLSHYVEAFRSGLREIGFIEGQNVALEYRWAESSDQLLEFARQLTALNVDVIFATSSTETGAARIATKP